VKNGLEGCEIRFEKTRLDASGGHCTCLLSLSFFKRFIDLERAHVSTEGEADALLSREQDVGLDPRTLRS